MPTVDSGLLPALEQWLWALLLAYAIVAAFPSILAAAAHFTTLTPMTIVTLPDCTQALKQAVRMNDNVKESRLYFGEELALHELKTGRFLVAYFIRWRSGTTAVLTLNDYAPPPDSPIAVSWGDTLLLGDVRSYIFDPRRKGSEKRYLVTVRFHSAIYELCRLREHFGHLGWRIP